MRRESFKVLEAEIGKIRDRLERMPTPDNPEGRALLLEARQFVTEIEALLGKARGLSSVNSRKKRSSPVQ